MVDDVVMGMVDKNERRSDSGGPGGGNRPGMMV